ncbi:MAG: EF-hand domain-containing protein [Cyanobacteria bacterium NC_groundwater_1444_Ag_S-0.65um_54_12]|nr:EF-hand domain-containing protein [Cyanobacteria bacterium NC_groundwater_1444_Ag_S-0.65um_54_12]
MKRALAQLSAVVLLAGCGFAPGQTVLQQQPASSLRSANFEVMAVEDGTASLAANPQEGKFTKLYERLDADHDGKITFEEFKAMDSKRKLNEERLKAFFDRLDANHDGVLTIEELKPLKDKAKDKMHGPGKQHCGMPGKGGWGRPSGDFKPGNFRMPIGKGRWWRPDATPSLTPEASGS